MERVHDLIEQAIREMHAGREAQAEECLQQARHLIAAAQDGGGQITPVFPGQAPIPPAPLPTEEIQEIHAGLMIPSEKAIHSMSREILKARGIANPDLI
jgi:hypothetical protein